MSTRSILVILLGALPATGWTLYLSLEVEMIRSHWVVVSWLGTAALWAIVLGPKPLLASPVLKLILAVALLGGIFVAAVPVGMHALALLEYALALSWREILQMLGVILSLLSPIAASLYCLRSIFLTVPAAAGGTLDSGAGL